MRCAKFFLFLFSAISYNTSATDSSRNYILTAIAPYLVILSNHLMHEMGHALAAKILFNIESEIQCPLNMFTEGVYTLFLEPLPSHGWRRALVAAAGPLFGLLHAWLALKIADSVSKKEISEKVLIKAIQIPSYLCIFDNLVGLCIPHRVSNPVIKFNDAYKIYNALGLIENPLF